MPISLSEIIKARKTIRIDVGQEDNLEIEFKTNFYTPATRARLQEADDELACQIEIMANAITAWNVRDGAKNVPVNVESLSALSIALLNRVFTAMLEATLPNAEPGSS